jgi:hypothetical protein
LKREVAGEGEAIVQRRDMARIDADHRIGDRAQEIPVTATRKDRQRRALRRNGLRIARVVGDR